MFKVVIALVLTSVANAVAAVPNIHLLFVYSSVGDYSGLSGPYVEEIWTDFIYHKVQTDPTWPFNVTVETMDVLSDCDVINSLLEARLNNSQLEPIIGILAEGDLCGPGAGSAKIAARYRVPIILTAFNPDLTSDNYKMPDDQFTAFLMEGASVRTQREAVSLFSQVGVKTAVVVALQDGSLDSYNSHTCFGAGQLLASRGIKILDEITITSVDYIEREVDRIKNMDPDVVMWCDVLSCVDPGRYQYLAPAAFHKANYLPKAMTMLDCVDNIDYPNQEEMKYVLGNQYVNNKLKGFLYTEDATPYASHFRPETPDDFDEIQQLNLGVTDELPTSTKLFYNEFFSRAGSYPGIYDTTRYAAYDVMEAAIYQSITDPRVGNAITAEDVFQRLKINKVRTPLGLVGFDNDQITTLTDVLILQVQALQSKDTAEIVAPSRVRTQPLVYPMPTWDERVYQWSLTDGDSQQASIGVASACTLILFLLATVCFIFKEETEIKMLNHWHIILLCLAAAGLAWSAALAWQADQTQAQCDVYLWVIYLPASFLISLLCMKAYRLSLIMIAAKRRKRMNPLTQARVLLLSLIPVAVTAIVLLIIALADPPTAEKVVVDHLRPKFDYHVCRTGEVAPALLSVIAALHIIFSIFCISAVRNGSELFEDGVLMKESFIMFYACLVVLIVLNFLDLDYKDFYVLRTVLLSFGAMFFCTRLLLGRCLKRLLPEKLYVKINSYMSMLLKPTSANAANNSKASSNQNESIPLENDDFQAEVAAAQRTDIGAMLEALQDPTRRKNFHDLATKSFVGENSDFLCAVLDFKKESFQKISDASVSTNEWAQKRANEIMDEYCKQNAPQEVNISSSVRSRLASRVDKWPQQPLISVSKLDKFFKSESDPDRIDIFHKAFKEIGLMLYQNLWSKFCNAETSELACEGTSSVKIYSEVV